MDLERHPPATGRGPGNCTTASRRGWARDVKARVEAGSAAFLWGAPARLVARPEGRRTTVVAAQQRASPAADNTTGEASGGQGFDALHHAGRAGVPIIAGLASRRAHGTTLATSQEISSFLAEVERRAFKHAMFAVRDEDAALDIVQDAMLKLAERYADKPAGELPLLFQRILQNTIHDQFRRQKVRSTWTVLLSALGRGEDKDDDFDPLEAIPAKSHSGETAEPSSQLEQREIVSMIEGALSRLPARQREAFLLRYWEELDVAETAAAMGCSEGSVKTHCSRAVHALSGMLSALGIKP